MPYNATSNPYRDLIARPDAPATRAVAITTHNTNDLDTYVKAFRCNTGGTVSFIPARNADSEIITIDVVAGEIVPIMTRRIRTTGTTATGIVGLFD